MVQTNKPTVLQECVDQVSSSVPTETVQLVSLCVMVQMIVATKATNQIVVWNVRLWNSNASRMVVVYTILGSVTVMLTVKTEVMKIPPSVVRFIKCIKFS